VDHLLNFVALLSVDERFVLLWVVNIAHHVVFLEIDAVVHLSDSLNLEVVFELHVIVLDLLEFRLSDLCLHFLFVEESLELVLVLHASLCFFDHLSLFMVDLRAESLVQDSDLILALEPNCLLFVTGDIFAHEKFLLSCDTKGFVVFFVKGAVFPLIEFLFLDLPQLLHLN
jgi:hypothetical protein